MNALWDPKSKQYRVYSKTWIDGIDGNMFWKRAVAMYASTDLVDFPSNTGHLCLYPDEHDGVDTAYLPGSGNVGVELHAGQCAFLRRIPSEYAPCHVYGSKYNLPVKPTHFCGNRYVTIRSPTLQAHSISKKCRQLLIVG